MFGPNYIEIEPTLGCNLRCRMCHVSFMKEPVKYLDLDKIDFSFLKGKLVTLGAVFEPCIHPKINQLIDTLNKLGCRIVLITNGHNLHRRDIPALFDSNLEMVTFSFDGISKETYESVRVGGNFERTLDNIEKFRQSFIGSDTLFAVNFTVMKCNLHEVVGAADFWGKRGIDVLRYISMVVREDDEFLHKNSLWDVREEYFSKLDLAAAHVLNSSSSICLTSPYFQSKKSKPNGYVYSNNPDVKLPRQYPREYQFGADFGMNFPCKSPFVAARIMCDGNVMLCHNQFIGNLYESSFDEIWSSDAASSLRGEVLNSSKLCSKCDYFRFCLSSHFVDLDQKENYYSQPMLDKSAEISLKNSVEPIKMILSKPKKSIFKKILTKLNLS